MGDFGNENVVLLEIYNCLLVFKKMDWWVKLFLYNEKKFYL